MKKDLIYQRLAVRHILSNEEGDSVENIAKYIVDEKKQSKQLLHTAYQFIIAILLLIIYSYV